MGEIIVRKVRGMNWKAKLSLVLIFTMIFSSFMHQGWYSPRIEKAEAASGDVILLWDTADGSVPAGWTSISSLGTDPFYGAMPMAASSYGGSIVGSDTHSHTLTYSSGAVQGASSTVKGTTGGTRTVVNTHTHTWNGASADGAHLPPYKNLVFIRASNPTQIPVNAIAMFDTSSPGANWASYSALNSGNYLRGFSDNATGGSATHTHTVSFASDTAAVSIDDSGSGTAAADAHSHTVSGTISTAGTNAPPYVNVYFAKNTSGGAISIPSGLIAMFDAAPTGNWAAFSAWNGYFLKGATSSIGTTGGNSASHNHGGSVTLSSANCTVSRTNQGTTGATTAATDTHNHGSSLSHAISGMTPLPAYRDVILAKYTPPSGNMAVADGTSMGTANAPRSSTNNALDSFTLAMSAGSGTVSTITITGNASFTATNIPTNGVKIYRDSGTVGAYDSGVDTLISSGSTAISGNATTVTLSSSEPVTSTANYLVTVDINSGATLSQQITGTVTAVTGSGLGTPTYNDSGSATLTVTAAQTLTIGDGATLGAASAPQSSTNRALDSFTSSLNSGSGTISTLTVAGSANFNSTNIPTNGVKIYRDAGTIGAYNSGVDTLISSGSTAISGNSTTVTLASPETVTTTSANYLVTVDINSGATLSQSFTGTISAATGSGIGTPVDSDTGSATLTVTAPSQPSTIDSCSGCHQYSPTFADGTARNTPEGQFPGSHNQHVQGYSYACSVCHVVPATETSSDFKHRNGNIQMSGSVTYGTGASWAQTNNPSFAACTNTACHGDSSNTSADAGNWGTSLSASDACTVCHGTKAAGAADGSAAAINRAPGGNATGVDTSGTSGAGTITRNVSSIPKVGAHDAHLRGLTGISNAIDCTECHAVPEVTVAGIKGHLDGTPANMTWGALATTNGAPGGYDSGTKTCSSVYCHNEAYFTTTNHTNGGTGTSPVWNNQSYFTDVTTPLTSTECGRCHYYQAGTDCSSCHTHVSADDLSFGNASLHINGTVEGGDCVSCHSNNQDNLDGAPTRRAMSTELTNLAWSHKKTASGSWTKYDCGVCHMEGNPLTGATDPTYHKNNQLEFRDPDTGVTIKGVTFTGTPGSYSSTGTDAVSATFARNTGSNALESFAQAVMINLCVKCHDGGAQGGAFSSAARVSGGTATQPFGTSAGTVRDVKAHFATSNSSYHPVLGKNNNSYADGTTMAAPWDGITKTDGSTANYGYLMTCWDCHDDSAAGRTIGGAAASVTAHGAATQLRGDTWTSPSTLCTVCHLSSVYSNSGGVHATGSAFAVPIISNMKPDTRNCQYCHASAYTKPSRPTPAEDVHGFNALTTGGNWPGSNYASRPYAFIRNTEMFLNHRPKQSPEKTNANGACNLKSGATCSHNNMPTTANDASATYTPGGVY